MHRTRNFLVAFSYIALLASTGAPYIAFADATHDLASTPAVIDEKAKARDILKESITLTNTSDHKLELYPTVNNVNTQDGKQGFSPAENSQDLSNSLANWIELSRGVVELGPGEQKTVPFIIRINLNAVPDTYHAMITFGQGDTREEAEAGTPLAMVTVNVEIQADIKEDLQLNKFTSDSVVFTGDDVLFNYQLQNIGNQDLQPTGEIRIYDRKGAEVASVDVNKEGKTVSPDQTAQLASVWNGANGFGQFKALLTVNYGTSQTAAVEDTVFFWVIPWKQILALFGISIVAIVILAMYFRRWFEERHLGRLALAGVLKPDALAHFQANQTPVVSLPPVAEIKEKVQATVEQKKQAFSIFKRQGFASLPEPGSMAIVANVAPKESPKAQIDGGTINLKQIRKHTDDHISTDSHIINLKKNK